MRKGFVYHEDAGDSGKTLPRQGQFYVFINSAGLLQVINSNGSSVTQTQFGSGGTTGGTGGGDYLPISGGTVTGDVNFQGTISSGGTDLWSVFFPVDIENINIEKLGNPTEIIDLKKAYNSFWSAGSVIGFALTDNGDGTVDIASGEAVLRTSNTSTSPLVSLVVPGATGLSLTDNSVNYIYVDYNSGNPQVAISTSLSDFNCQDKCIIYFLSREGNEISYVDAGAQNIDSNRKHRRVLLETERFKKASAGTIVSASNRHLTVTSGKTFFGLEPIEHNAFDTSIAGTANENTFTYYYRDGVGGWTRINDSKEINNTQYDDGTGTLATLDRYRTDYIYLIVGEISKLAVIMGTNNDSLLSDATEHPIPTVLPPAIEGTGLLIGRAIIFKDNTTLTQIESISQQPFTVVSAVNHNELAGIQGGTTDEYYHLTASELAKLNGLENQSLPLSGGTGGPYTFTGNTNHTGQIQSGGTDLSQLFGSSGGSGSSGRWVISGLTEGTYTAEGDTAYFCDATAGNVNLELPLPSDEPGTEIFAKLISPSGGRINITVRGGGNIEGVTPVSISDQYRFSHFITDGNNWYNM